MIDVHERIAANGSIRATLNAIRELAEADVPFAASVLQLADQARDLDDFEQAMTSLYRIALDAQHPLLPDLADHVLQWTEQLRGQPTYV